ncbi:cytochrome f [Pantanalinema rosaneae CENA516]|uniref:cytochrome f n=1 Tax=Pantanalinema rosaneae TaxID=1620701 RepID=UPI003D6FB296
MRNFSLSLLFRRPAIAFKPALMAIVAITVFLAGNFAFPQAAAAYPVFAQQAYKNPREATGRIVCANCHLAAKPTEVEVPQAVLPDTVFEAVVKIPYDTSVQQVVGNGEKGPLNVGAVVMLPEGFKLAPEDRIPEELQEKVQDLYYQPYSEDQENIIVVGPLPGEQYQEIVFPILSPDPNQDKSIHFGKYSVHVGGNRGRGQVYPNGEKSNNAVFNASAAGQISQITKPEDGGYEVTIQTADGSTVVDTVPPGPELMVAEGQEVKAGDALTVNPNVGGFGQVDAEIVLQSPNRIAGLLAFFAIVVISQIMLVLKKKQIERVQAAEMEF